MVETHRSEQMQSRVPAWGAALLAYLSYAVLLEGVIEGWLRDSAVKWEMTAVVALYAGLTYLLWKRISAPRKAMLSFCVLLLLVASSSWLLGSASAEEGFSAVGLSSSVLAIGASILALGFAALLFWPLAFVPARVRVHVRIALALLLLWALAPFVSGLLVETPFEDLFFGKGFWERPPFWLQGAYVGLAVLLPLALLFAVLSVTAALVRRESTALSATLFQGIAVVLVYAMAIPSLHGMGLPHLAASLGRDAFRDAGEPAPPEPATRGEAKATAAQDGDIQALTALFDGLQSVQNGLDAGRFDVAAKAAQLGPDLEEIFGFVREQVRFEAYPGVLRDARGTLIGFAGNAIDQSLLLAALLRQHGFEVRFVRGSLDDDAREALARQMLDSHEPPPDDADIDLASVGVKPEDLGYGRRAASKEGARFEKFVEAVADSIEDQTDRLRKALRRGDVELASGAERASWESLVSAQNHFWVQVRRDDEWLDLDPSFRDAKPGQVFASEAQVADITSDLHHRVVIRVVVERLTQGALQQSTVLEQRFQAAELALARVEFSNAPDVSDFSALATASSFTPTLIVNGRPYTGSAFSLSGSAGGGMIGSPFGRLAEALEESSGTGGGSALSGEWIEFVVEPPGGESLTSRREILDRVGVAARGTDGPKAFRQEFEDELRVRYALLASIKILAPTFAYSRSYVVREITAQLLAQRPMALSAAEQIKSAAAEASPAAAVGSSPGPPLGLLLLSMLSDQTGRRLASDQDSTTIFYPDQPQIYLERIQLDRFEDDAIQVQQGIDIVDSRLQVLNEARRPDQAAEFRLRMGVVQGNLEHALATARGVRSLAAIEEEEGLSNRVEVLSTVAVLSKAQREGVDRTLLTPADRSDLADLEIGAEARLRLAAELDQGYAVLVPEEGLPINGAPHLAWWRVDPRTGQTVGMLDNGTGGMVEWYKLNETTINIWTTAIGAHVAFGACIGGVKMNDPHLGMKVAGCLAVAGMGGVGVFFVPGVMFVAAGLLGMWINGVI